jgi:ATP phosphoribosyltransferase
MDPAVMNPQAIHARIVAELEIDHLTTEEQDQIVQALGEVLLERATYEVMKLIPEHEYETLDTFAEEGKDGDMQELIKKYVGNIENIVAQAVQDGIAEHKRLVAEEVASRVPQINGGQPTLQTA